MRSLFGSHQLTMVLFAVANLFVHYGSGANALAQTSPRTMGIIERLDPAVNDLVPRDAEMEVIAQGLQWAEGPVWIRDGRFLLFSDVLTNTIHRWDRETGCTPFIIPSGYTGSLPRGAEMGSNGLNVDGQGRLLLCQHGDRRVARLGPPFDSSRKPYETVADRYDGKRFNSPNDLVVHSSGVDLFHRPALRARTANGRPRQGAAAPGRVPDRPGWQGDTALHGARATERNWVFTGRENFVRRQFAWPADDRDGVPGPRGRYARRRPRVF